MTFRRVRRPPTSKISWFLSPQPYYNYLVEVQGAYTVTFTHCFKQVRLAGKILKYDKFLV